MFFVCESKVTVRNIHLQDVTHSLVSYLEVSIAAWSGESGGDFNLIYEGESHFRYCLKKLSSLGSVCERYWGWS